MSKPALRVGDPVLCTCDPRCRGRVISGSKKTFINNKPAARAGDLTNNCCGCKCPCPNKILMGSVRTFIEGKGAARVGDPISSGKSVRGSKDTFIG